MGLEEILQDAGGFGRMQVVVLLVIYLGKLFCGWSVFQMTFAGMVPEFTCESSDGGDDLGFSQLPKNVTSNECLIPLNISITSSTKAECMTFNYTSPFKTAMKDFDLVCERSWIKPTLTSIQMAGFMIGCIASGQMGDSIGRWRTNLIFVVLHNMANIAAAFSPGWEVFAVCRFVIGAGIGGILVVGFTHPVEFMVMKWRPVCAATPAWMLGVAIFAFNAWLLQDWRKLHLVCGITGLLQVPLLFLVPESIRWLAVQGRIDQAVATADKVARWNGRPHVMHARSTLEEVYKEELKARLAGTRYTYMAILRPWSTAIVTLKVCYHWACYSLAYYGISFGVSNLAGNFFLNVFLLGFIDAPVQMITFYTNNKFGRKWSALFFVVVSFGSALGCMILQVTGVGGKQSTTITALSLLSKTGILTAWGIMQTWGSELYPTVIRNLGYGAANTSARVAGIFAPLVIDFGSRMTESYVIIGALLTVDIVLVLLLPDTKGLILPDTMADLESKDTKGNGKIGHEMEPVTDTITYVDSQHDKSGESLLKANRDVDGFRNFRT